MNDQAQPEDLDLKTMQQVEACGYEAIQRKGRGTYGFVYEVGDAQGDLFAFKYILPDPFYQDLGLDSLNEIDVLTRINHPHIIHASKVITAHNCHIDGLAIILPLADRTLFDIIKDPKMTTERNLPILYKLATAVDFLHRAKILHLDIKSTNVVLQGLNENAPYLIDFGLCMSVDNVETGRYDNSTRVTMDHRAPEILAGGRIYNGAVDIWAFGIMMLYLLSGRNIYQVDFTAITDYKLHAIIVNLFSTPTYIENLLVGVREKYRPICLDFFSKVLVIDPSKRLTAREICDHPIFDEFRYDIDGYLVVPPIAHDYANDHRDILKLLLHWAQTVYGKSRAELLFLAVDLYNRVDSFYKNREAIDRMHLAATSLWVASKLTDSKSIPISVYVHELVKMVPGISGTKILDTEIEIIHLLSGVLNVSNLYRICETGDELNLTLQHVILDRDSTLYARTDTNAWLQVMKDLVPNPQMPQKDITINQLIQGH